MKRTGVVIVGMALLGAFCPAQDAGNRFSSGQSNTVIGCLSDPDADDHYTLTSMQHRTGVDVVGGEDLKKGVGGKVKLTGSWELLPGSEGKTGDAAHRFNATQVTILEDTCHSPAPVTPVSKSKQQKK